MVAVNYQDLLSVTLGYNRHHFSEVFIITDTKSSKEVDEIARQHTSTVLVTDLFYESNPNGFNKWRALEWGLDQMGRRGWICNMDADVLWPKGVEIKEVGEALWVSQFGFLKRGQLMAPLRRIAPWPLPTVPGEKYPESGVPLEAAWSNYPIHRNVGEWAGYSQIFHAEDPHLGPAPWHEVDWVHAGGADSIFQRKWPREAKVRPNWEVLHLGDAGKNWFGRATPMANGTVPTEAQERLEKCAEIWRGRAERRGAGMSEAETFRPEKLGG
jgi:hypothetical protein